MGGFLTYTPIFRLSCDCGFVNGNGTSHIIPPLAPYPVAAQNVLRSAPARQWPVSWRPGCGNLTRGRPIPTPQPSLRAPEIAQDERSGLTRLTILSPRLDPSGSPPRAWGQRKLKNCGGAGPQREDIDRISKHFGRTQSSGDRAGKRQSLLASYSGCGQILQVGWSLS